MHEYSLTKRIVQIANDTAASHCAGRVITVFLVIGENRSVIPDSLQLYFDIIAKGTPAEGAALEIRTIKAEMYCPQCQKNFHRPRFSFACPDCQTLGSPTPIGNEGYVERVELE